MSVANVSSMFQNSVALHNLIESITPDTDVQQVLLDTQLTINSFIGEIGACLKSDIHADTYVMYHTIFSNECEQYFAVTAVLFNTDTRSQEYLIFPFLFLLSNPNGLSSCGHVLTPGLYYIPNLDCTHFTFK